MSLIVPNPSPVKFTLEDRDCGTISWYDANGGWHCVAVMDDDITYEDGDAGDRRSDAIVDRLASIGESRDERITRGSGGDVRSCAVRLATLRD